MNSVMGGAPSLTRLIMMQMCFNHLSITFTYFIYPLLLAKYFHHLSITFSYFIYPLLLANYVNHLIIIYI